MHLSDATVTVIQKKVCLLGAFAVGKTSLVRRFVESIFSDRYHTTIGVKVDKKVIHVGNQELSMILWDIQGKTESQPVRPSYLAGASGFLIIADGTRRGTLDVALEIAESSARIAGNVPMVLALNKNDLVEKWEVEREQEQGLIQAGWAVIRTSAKTGEAVEHAFNILARKIVSC